MVVGAGAARLHRRLRDVQAPGRRRVLRDHHAGGRADPSILIIGQQGYTGGVNGITDLRTLLGWDIRTDSAKYILYFVNAASAARRHARSRAVVQQSKLGTLLLAMRDHEDRVRFSGYDVANFKIFVFCLAAAMSRRSAARCSPCRSASCRRRFVGIVPSIEMVIFAAVGGRHVAARRGLRHAAGQLRQDYFSESFPELWLFLMGGLFIAVVMVFPNGLAGLWRPITAMPRGSRS